MGRRGGQQDSGGRAGADAAPGALPSRRQARTKKKEAARRGRQASGTASPRQKSCLTAVDQGGSHKNKLHTGGESCGMQSGPRTCMQPIRTLC
jgi:hypothetical protein